MDMKQLFILCASALASALCGPAVSQEMQGQYIQVAEIEIDLGQLNAYRTAVKEQIETAIRVEPGVLVLFAVSEKDNQPTSRFSKSIGIRMRTSRIWSPLI